MTSTGRAPAAWYPDPTGRHHQRFWDGERWTIHVVDDGEPTVDDRVQRPVEPAGPTTPTVTGAPAPAPAPAPTPASGPVPAAVPPLGAGLVIPPARRRTGGMWIVVGIVVIALLGVGVAVVATTTQKDDTGQRYPAAIEANFLRGCTSQGAPIDICRCGLEKIEKLYDLESFISFDRAALTTGKLPDDVAQAMQECVISHGQVHQTRTTSVPVPMDRP